MTVVKVLIVMIVMDGYVCGHGCHEIKVVIYVMIIYLL